MNRKTRFLALTTVTLIAAAMASAACSKSKSSGPTPTPTAAVVLEGNGSPANFVCNGSFQDPPSTGTDVHFQVTTVAQSTSTTTDQPGVSVTLLAGTGAAATITTTGSPVVSNAQSISTLVVHDNTRVSFLGTLASGPEAPYLDSYNYFYLSPAVGNTASQPANNSVRMIPNALFSLITGFVAHLPSLTGTYQFAGAVGDCTSQGSQIANATVELTGASLCGNAPTLPCIVYITGTGTPNVGATETDKNGAFIILGLTPNTPVKVKVFGVTTSGKASEEIGAIAINGSAGAVSLGSTEPIGPSNPG